MTDYNMTDSEIQFPASFDEVKYCFAKIGVTYTSEKDKEFNYSLFWDFCRFCTTAGPLFTHIFGEKWFDEARIFRFANRDKYPLRPELNKNGRFVQSGWNIGKGLTAAEICSYILGGKNFYFDPEAKKDRFALVCLLTDTLVVIDVDFHTEKGDTRDQREDFYQSVLDIGVSCVYEPSKNGAHYIFQNCADAPISNEAKKVIQSSDSAGIPYEVEFCSGVWNDDDGKYKNSKCCVLGCGRVDGYADKVQLLNPDGSLDFPTCLRPIPEASIPVREKGRPKKTDSVILETDFSQVLPGERNDVLFRFLCAEAEVLKKSRHAHQLLRDLALANWYKLPNKDDFSLEDAYKCADSAARYIGEGDSVDEFLYSLCRVPEDGVRYALEQTGYSLSFNKMNSEISVLGETEIELNSLNTKLHNVLRRHLTPAIISDNLMAIARQNSTHPVLEYLKSLPVSDDDSELQKIYALLQIQEKDLEKSYLKKWLMQAVCALYNGDNKYYFPCEYVLVLKGEQGAGKTSLFAHLAIQQEYFERDYNLDPEKVDSVRIATSKWITELGEIESTTTRRDMGALKAFIDRSTDSFRIQYERFITRKPRQTVFCGTVNGDQFLRDETGNRRFLVIELPKDYKLNFSEIEAINVAALWSYIFTQVTKLHEEGIPYGALWRLTREEEESSVEHVKKYNCMSSMEAELLEMIVLHPEELRLNKNSMPIDRAVNWKTAHDLVMDLPFTQKPNINQLSRVLRRLGVQSQVNREKKNVYAIFMTVANAAKVNFKCNNPNAYKGLLLADDDLDNSPRHP